MAQAFVIVVKRYGHNLTVSNPVTVHSSKWGSWSVLADSQNEYISEVWVPSEVAGTNVTVVVDCSSLVTYTLEPVIPSNINLAPDVDNFYVSSVSDDTDNTTTPHTHWWAIELSGTEEGFLWTELCQVPPIAYTLAMRIVLPNRNVTNNLVCSKSQDNYFIQTPANFRESSYAGVSMSANWYTRQLQSRVMYVSVYAVPVLGNNVPLTFNVYFATEKSPPQYIETAAGYYNLVGIQVEDDLYINSAGTSSLTNTSMMQLFYYDISGSKKTVPTEFFVSACYLKNQQLQLSNFSSAQLQSVGQGATNFTYSVVKAPDFFEGKLDTFYPLVAVTYGQYLVMPNFVGAAKVNNLFTPTDIILVSVASGLAFLLLVSIIIITILCVKLSRRNKYQRVRDMQNVAVNSGIY